MMTSLICENISVSAKDASLVKNASFILKPGEITALLGPNGAGKTSLLRGALGLLPLTSGTAKLGSLAVGSLSASERAKSIAYLPQTRPLAWPNVVKDIVALGRFSHGANLARLSGEDKDAVDAAMTSCDIEHLAGRRADTLSGGELARVHIARAMAARAPLLIADEPVAALDPRHQFRVMELIKAYVENGGGALVVLHDIALAAKYADRLLWMKDGEIIADGSVADTLTSQRLAEIYGVKADVNGMNVTLHGAIE